MSLLITLLVAVLVIAIVLWIVSLIPMDGRAKQILQVVIAVALLLFLLAVVLGYAPMIHVR